MFIFQCIPGMSVNLFHCFRTLSFIFLLPLLLLISLPLPARDREAERDALLHDFMLEAESGPVDRRHEHRINGKRKPCDHVSFHSNCVHCFGYCFRCCMKHICGGNQDDYIELLVPKTTNVEENHKVWLSDGSAKKHSETKGKPISIFQNPSYKTAYEKLLEKKRFIGGIWIDGSGIHTDIIYGIRLNRADGTVDGEGIVVYWNPTSAQNQLEHELANYRRIYPEK